jgi:hypothetical protein
MAAGFLLSPLHAEPIQIKVISWNLQSDQSSDDFVAAQAAQKGVIDIWGLSEVRDQETLTTFENAIEEATGIEYTSKLSEAGSRDRLAILFNATVFNAIDVTPGDQSLDPFFEIKEVQVTPGLRPGLAVLLEGRRTGQRFFLVANHFKCCGGQSNIATRVAQAEALNAFANSQSLPVMAIGDFNTPTPVSGDVIPDALHTMTVEGPFQWVKPGVLVPTEDTGSVLDYLLVANPVEGWTGTATILRRAGNNAAQPGDPFVDTAESTDHRPVLGVFTLHSDSRIEELEEELALLDARRAEILAELERLRNPPEGQLRIIQLVPNPAGADDNAESVTIENVGGQDIDLSGWSIGDDDSLGEPWPLSGIIAPAEQRVIVRAGAGMQLGNGGDTIRLIAPDGAIVHEVSYGPVQSGEVVTP